MASPAAALPPNASEDQRATVIGSVVFCLLWSTLMVGLRLWTRGVVIKKLGVDDYMCLVGLVSGGPLYQVRSTFADPATLARHIRSRCCHRAHDRLWPG
jgi:hypothetical protein